jgi:preprotein translocase subunit SecA
LPHQVLNAKQHAREAEIVAQAGRPKMITIATNMAGRGTDIVLGGNVEKAIEAIEADESLDAATKQQRIAELREQWQKDHEQIVKLGGLRIIATERHESRRIDNQLRGRSGRQGDPGSSRFYLSLDDPLMRIFAGDRVRAIMERLKMPDGEAIEAGIVTRSIESAQRKVEGRKQLLEYDDVANDQRKVIYQQRNDILDAQALGAQIASLREGCFTDLVHQYVPPESVEEQWDIAGLEKVLVEEWGISLPLKATVEAATAITDEDIVEKVVAAANAAFEAKVEQIGEANFTHFERMVLLQSIDSHWREHLAALDYLRQGIHLRGYAQKQPKQEYKREAFELFGQMLDAVKNEVTRMLMTVKIQSAAEVEQAAEDLEDRAERIANVTYTAPTETGEVESTLDAATLAQQQRPVAAAAMAAAGGMGMAASAVAGMPRVGRNDPCPCGSGKKFKNCHGQLT